MKLWYALHVRSNHEHLVAEQLDGAGIDAFYPHVTEKSKDKKRDIERKFMPGYVFANFSLAHKTPVVAIQAVVAILGWGRHAVPIPASEIEAVRMIVSYPEAAVEPCAYLDAGDRVLVTSGPLKGLEGYVSYSASNRAARVIVSVSMLQRSISAEVDVESLEVLERAELPKAA